MNSLPLVIGILGWAALLLILYWVIKWTFSKDD